MSKKYKFNQLASKIKSIVSSPFSKIIIIFAMIRLFIFIVSIIGQNMLPEGPAFNHNLSESAFINSWAQFDANAYLDISRNGYRSDFMDKGNYQWWPLYPILLHFSGKLVGDALGGFLLSNIFFIIALIFIFKLLKLDFKENTALNAVILLIIFPTSFFFSAIYSESLFLMLVVMSFYFARKSNWALAGVFAMFASVTRIFGILIAIPLAYLYLKSLKFSIKKLDTKALSLLIIPLLLFTYIFYLYEATGNPIKFMDHSQTSNRGTTFPFLVLYYEFSDIIQHFSSFTLFYHSMNIIFFLGAFALILFFMRKIPAEYSIYSLLILFVISSSTPLEGIVRYVLIIFPVFISMSLMLSGLLARFKKHKSLIWSLLLASLLIITSVFVLWYTRGGIQLG